MARTGSDLRIVARVGVVIGSVAVLGSIAGPGSESSDTAPSPAPTAAVTGWAPPGEYDLRGAARLSSRDKASDDFFGQVNDQRKMLRGGEVSAAVFTDVEVGKAFPVDLMVCARTGAACSVTELPPTGVAEAGSATTPRKRLGAVPVGSLVKADLVSFGSDVTVERIGEPTQVFVSAEDAGNWSWKVTTKKPGVMTLRVVLTSMMAASDHPLVAPRTFQIQVRVSEPFPHWLSRVAGNTWAKIGGGATLATLVGVFVAYLAHRHNRGRSNAVAPVSPGMGPVSPAPVPVRRGTPRHRR